MKENIKDQITRLSLALKRAQRGIAAPQNQLLLNNGNQEFSMAERLEALNIALLRNIFDTVDQRLEQVTLAMAFARYVTFYAHRLNPDVDIWTHEINDDINLQINLLQGAQQDVQLLALQAPRHEKSVKALNNHAGLLREFNHRQQRRTDAKTLYSIDEKPFGIGDAQGEAAILDIRKQQYEKACQGIDMLIDRALLSLKRVHLIRQDIYPLFQKAADGSAGSWDKEALSSEQHGHNALNEATALASHLPRLHNPLDLLPPKA